MAAVYGLRKPCYVRLKERREAHFEKSNERAQKRDVKYACYRFDFLPVVVFSKLRQE